MGELFVQGSTIVSEKVKEEEKKSGTQDEKKGKKRAESSENITKKTIYSHDEAIKASECFNGDELAARVWANKYALKDSFGNLYEKTPDDMHRRHIRDTQLKTNTKILCQKNLFTKFLRISDTLYHRVVR